MPLVDFVECDISHIVEGPNFGLEVEVENVPHLPMLSGTGWHTVHDGSLRDGGMEFLSRGPRTRQQAVQDVIQLYNWKRQGRWGTGVRTSTHVHVNVQSHSVSQVAAATTLYTIVEPLLYRYCGPLREENIYCVPWYRAPQELKHMRRAYAAQHPRDLGYTCKYSGLYLEPVLRFGTVEFRQAPVFDDYLDLLDWIQIAERIVYSGFDTPEEVLETYGKLDPAAFILGVFGEHLYTRLQDRCETPFAELLDHYDTLTLAERVLDSTYHPTPSAWEPLQFNIEGDGARGYHIVAPANNHLFQDSEFYHEPDERDYDEEEW